MDERAGDLDLSSERGAFFSRAAAVGKSSWLWVISTGLMPVVWFGRAAS